MKPECASSNRLRMPRETSLSTFSGRTVRHGATRHGKRRRAAERDRVRLVCGVGHVTFWNRSPMAGAGGAGGLVCLWVRRRKHQHVCRLRVCWRWRQPGWENVGRRGCGGAIIGPTKLPSSGESVSWIAFPTGYLSVDNNGNVTGLSATPPDITVTVTAVYTNGSGSANLTVTGPTLQSVAVTDVDNGAALSEKATYSPRPALIPTLRPEPDSYVSWVSSVPAVADIATAPVQALEAIPAMPAP